jgi:hypothetical protein
VGNGAGRNITGSYNIDIANLGTANDSGIIRIGTTGSQTAAFLAGVENSKVTGAAVYVTSSGQPGVLASSERYKTDIKPMETSADRLAQLRPVTFHLKSEPHGVVQYGLIAEEVEKVYPELVIRDAAGEIQGVRYDELAPLLLKQVQDDRDQAYREHQQNIAAIDDLKQQVATLKKQYESTQVALAKLLAAGNRVAMR